jgi:CobQ-like glutamine amidotransferase family enzyme
MPGMDLRVCHLYPDLLNLYGDRGNLMALVNRARWRGVDARVDDVGLGDPLRVGAHDFYFIGGGEDRQQVVAAADLRDSKREALVHAAGRGAVVLAVCGGYQLLGHYYRPAEGEDLIGIGLLDITTEHPGPRARRLVGNIVISSELTRGQTLVGFENHGGRTRLGPAARPLGTVLTGFGNNGEDHGEGAVSGTVVGTYLHGPLLPKNPALTDYLLGIALRLRYGEVPLQSLDDRLELAAHAAALIGATSRA